MVTAKTLRRRILKKRGLEEHSYGRLVEVDRPDLIIPENRTMRMVRIELEQGKPLEELLMDGDLNEVANRLGIDFTTVSKWRLRLGLRRMGGNEDVDGTPMA